MQQYIVNTLISIPLLVIIPLLLAKIFEKVDKDFELKLRKKDIIIIVISAIVSGVLLGGSEMTTLEVIHISVIVGYLIFMSYTDQRTKLLYSSVSFLMILVEGIILTVKWNSIQFNEYSWTIVLVPILLFILSLFRGIGLGDVYIYIVLCIYYTEIRLVPTMSAILNILITNIMFVVVTLVLMITRKNKERHQPLTIYIAISTIICSILQL
jgi:hypothetical protein